MKFARLLSLLIMLLVVVPASAQEGYPLPENLPIISTDNAAQVSQIARVGGGLPGELVWSPDGHILAAGTSQGVKLYDADDLTAAPDVIETRGADVLFSPDGETLVSGGHIWDVQTRESIAEIGASGRRAFSPSGNILLTSRFEDEQTVVSLFDAKGKPLATMDTGSTQLFWGAVFNADESLVAIKLIPADSFYDDTPVAVQLWDVKTGKLAFTFTGMFEVIGQVAFVNGGRYLLFEDYSDAPYGGPFGGFQLWDVKTGELATSVDYAFSLTISPDGSTLFYEQSGFVKGLVLDSLETFELNNWGYQIGFSKDGKLMAASGYTTETHASIAIWKVRENQRPGAPYATVDGDAFVFSPNSRMIAAVSKGVIHIWDTQTLAEKAVIDPQIPEDTYNWRMYFNDAGDRLLLSYGANSRTWDAASGKLLTTVPRGYSAAYNLSTMRTAYWEGGRIHALDLESGADTLLPAIEDYTGDVADLDAAHDKVVFKGNGLQVYDLLTGTRDFQLNAKADTAALSLNADNLLIWEKVPANPDRTSFSLHNIIRSDTFDYNSPDVSLDITRETPIDKQVYATSADFAAWAAGDVEKLYDLKTGNVVACWSRPGEYITSNTFTPDGKLLILGSEIRMPRQAIHIVFTLWDVEKLSKANSLPGCPAAEPYSVYTLGDTQFGQIYDLIFNADSSQIALAMDFPDYGDSVAHNYYVFLIPTEKLFTPGADLNQETLPLIPFENAYWPQFSTDGQFLVTARSEHRFQSQTSQVQLWNPSQDEPLATVSSTGAAAFSPSGDLLVTFDKGVLSWWDVAALATGDTQPLITLDTNMDRMQEIAFSADGTRLYVRGNQAVLVYGVSAS